MQDSHSADDRHHKLASQRVLFSRTTADVRSSSWSHWGSHFCSSSRFCTRPAPSGGFADWRPVLYAYLVCRCLRYRQIVVRGERGLRALFLLPAVLFTVAVVIFPTLFGLYIASLDWNLSSFEARTSTARQPHQLVHDNYYWNASATCCSTRSPCLASMRSRSGWHSF